MLEIKTDKVPKGDQPKAIKQLVDGLNKKHLNQCLLGVTGSGKTFTIANVIEKVQKPTLVIAHNKTLAAQLCSEFRSFFPNNEVHYFVSYYDYYQPEAYLPSSDTYIDKEALINDEIDRLRHAATSALLTQRDTIIVSSVSCIYGLGTPEVYQKYMISIKEGEQLKRDELIRKLLKIQYTRTNADLQRGTFRTRGNKWEIMPPNEEIVYSFELNNGVENIYRINPVKGFRPDTPLLKEFFISPAKHFITETPELTRAIGDIKKELSKQLKYFEKNNLLLEAERLERRTKADISMMREVGYCNGIENYSRHLTGREAGKPSSTLLDYFPDDFLTVIDESHVTIPQINGMYGGDRARKNNLIKYGFRLPSARDNRPLMFDEFLERTGQMIFTTATPGPYEKEKSSQIVEQIIRPTGLIDPKITISPVKTQVDHIIRETRKRVEKKERVLITTLTKKMAENLSDYLKEEGLKVNYLHSDVKTLDRIKILTELRQGKIDVLVGVNLLREGLDLPEVTLIGILDADKEGFLRSETSLIQTIGRAARNTKGEVILYADNMTGSIKRAVETTDKRRKKQIEYNKKHNITPKTIKKDIFDIVPAEEILSIETAPLPKGKKSLKELIRKKEIQMKKASEELDFELATILRDEIRELSKKV